MRTLSFFSLVAVSAALNGCVTVPDQPQWVWTGFEVVGQRTVDREAIIREISLKLGTNFVEDRDAWQQCGDRLKKRFGFAYVQCSAVRFFDFKAYLEVNIVERGDEERLRFRPEPAGDPAPIGNHVLEVYKRLRSRADALFEQGKPPLEFVREGVLDYEDPEMHRLVVELSKLTPKWRDKMIAVIEGDRDIDDRADAAWLLNWAGSTVDSIRRTVALMDDPSLLVRNDLSRFMLHFVGDIKDAGLRREVIRSMARQLSRPSHADRNKAINNLMAILRSSPQDRALVKELAGDEIDRIARQSILDNVGGVAREVQKILTPQDLDSRSGVKS